MRIKICGITNAADAQLADTLGVELLGFNFYPKSPRHITLEAARAILNATTLQSEAVGLFVEQDSASIADTLRGLPAIKMVQWHGLHFDKIRDLNLPRIMAFGIHNEKDVAGVKMYLEMCEAGNRLPKAVLLDAKIPGRHGGTGKTAPWHLLTDFEFPVPVLLAGGLTPDNVAEAIRIVRPWGVDVATGVESQPGMKDPERLRRFIGNTREAEARFAVP